MRTRRGAAVVAVVMATAMVLAGCARDTGGGGQAQGGGQDCPRNAPPQVNAAQAQPAPSPAPGDASKLKVGLAYDIGGRGDASFNDAAGAGLDRASAQLKMPKATEATAQPGESEDASASRLRQLVAQGNNPIIAVGFNYASAVKSVAAQNPQVRFGIVDDDTVTLPNVTPLVFAEEQGSFLVGAAAALKTTTCKVGFVGGVDNPLIQKFAAGYEQGVKAVAPNAQVDAKYISPAGDTTGFNDATKGTEIAKGEYDGGADIVFAAAGKSNQGVFAAAQTGNKKAIGVDSDQYNSPQLAQVKQVIMTSMIKRVDVAVYDYINAISKNDTTSLPKRFDLKVDGVGYSTSGGQIDDVKSQLDAYKAAIISGQIQVKSTK